MPRRRIPRDILLIKDAMAYVGSLEHVNICGAAVEFGFPYKSQGTDYFCSMKIFDESTEESGFQVNLFAEAVAIFPRVRLPGDIIVLHDILMKNHNGAVYALFDKKYSSFAVLESRSSVDFKPYHVSPRFDIINDDRVSVMRIRAWLANHRFEVGMNEYTKTLGKLEVGMFFDLVCKILHTFVDAEGMLVLCAWDGTDAPSVDIQTSPLPLQSLPLPRDAMQNFPSFGTILPINAGKFFQDLGIQLSGEQWVKLRNIKCELRAGLWQGILERKSNIRFLSNDDSAVQDCVRSYQLRLSVSVDHCLPPSNITEIAHRCIPFSTLRDATLWRAKEEKYIFRCIVRVIAVYPWDPQLFHRIRNYFCVLNLTLEDPTSRLHACLFSKNKEVFFNDHPLSVLKTKFNGLLGIAENAEAGDNSICRRPPWVQMCLQACCEDKRKPWETRVFHICDTSLV